MSEQINLLDLEGEFTLPSSRTRKVEKYNFPVMTICGIDPNKKGAGRKISFNKAAIDKLGYNLDEADQNVSFKFTSENGNVYVVNTTGTAVLNTYKVTKSGTFSNKNVYEYLCKKFNISDTSVDFDFKINVLDTVGAPGGLLVSMVEETTASETEVEETVEEPVTQSENDDWGDGVESNENVIAGEA